jgi:uncharacterized protein YfaS (alpha-2-macroglobulin family)
MIVGVSLVLCLAGQFASGHQAVKLFKIKVQLDKSVIERGDTHTIRYWVNDATTNKPVSGAIVRATVEYADGVTVRQFAATTNLAGKASISWQIENHATPGSFSVSFEVSASAYVTESFDNSFSVVAYGHHHK